MHCPVLLTVVTRKMKLSIVPTLLLLSLLSTVLALYPPLCIDRAGRWKIGKKTRFWCKKVQKARKRGDAAKIASYCEGMELYKDCPMSCNACPTFSPAVKEICVAPWMSEVICIHDCTPLEKADFWLKKKGLNKYGDKPGKAFKYAALNHVKEIAFSQICLYISAII